MANKVYNVLSICKDNSARSIIAEALMNRLGRDRFRAFSAGVHPNGELHPLALEMLGRHGLPTEGLASKSWEQVVAGAGDRIDFIIAIRDKAAGEECPVLPGRPLTACWNVVDPAAYTGTPYERVNAFRRVFRELENRIKIMACLRLEALDRLSLRQRVDTGVVASQVEARPQALDISFPSGSLST